MEKPNETEEKALAQRYYNGAQILLIKYMLHQGIITSAEEYAEKYAEVFDLLASGALQTKASLDWGKLRHKMQRIRDATADKVKSFKLFDDEEEGGPT